MFGLAGAARDRVSAAAVSFKIEGRLRAAFSCATGNRVCSPVWGMRLRAEGDSHDRDPMPPCCKGISRHAGIESGLFSARPPVARAGPIPGCPQGNPVGTNPPRRPIANACPVCASERPDRSSPGYLRISEIGRVQDTCQNRKLVSAILRCPRNWSKSKILSAAT